MKRPLQIFYLMMMLWVMPPNLGMAQHVHVIGNLRQRDCREIDSIVDLAARQLGWAETILHLKNLAATPLPVSDTTDILQGLLRPLLDEKERLLDRDAVGRKIFQLRDPKRRLLVYETIEGRDSANVSSLKTYLMALDPKSGPTDILIALNHRLTQDSVKVMDPKPGEVVKKCVGVTGTTFYKLELAVYSDNIELRDLYLQFTDSTGKPLEFTKFDSTGKIVGRTPAELIRVSDFWAGDPIPLHHGYRGCMSFPSERIFSSHCDPPNLLGPDGMTIEKYSKYYVQVIYKGDLPMKSLPPQLIRFVSFGESDLNQPCNCDENE
jgi:hypothetical protein